MRKENSAARRIPIWDNLPVFHFLSMTIATVTWWLFMRADDGPVEMFLADEPGIHTPFLLVIAGMLQFYLKASAHSKSRVGRIVTALVAPFIGVSIFFLLIALMELIADPSGLGAVLTIYAAFVAPLCLLASWKTMLFPMILTCYLAEHIATLGKRSSDSQQKKLREALRSPAAHYLFLRNGRLPDVSRPHRF